MEIFLTFGILAGGVKLFLTIGEAFERRARRLRRSLTVSDSA